MLSTKSGKQPKLKDLFPFKPEAKVIVVWDNGYQRKIEPTQGKMITCPMCGGSEGYTSLVNPKVSHEDYQWGCLKPECVEINDKGAKKVIKAYWEKKAREQAGRV